MNKKITRGEFASSVDRSLSGIRPDPDLCRRIISSERGVSLKLQTDRRSPEESIGKQAIRDGRKREERLRQGEAENYRL